MNFNGNMDHEESLANNKYEIKVKEQKQEMKENTVTTPHSMADKQKIQKSSQVVIGAEPEKRQIIKPHGDYTYWQHLAVSLELEVKEYLLWCSTSLEIPEHLKEDWYKLTTAIIKTSESIVKHTNYIKDEF
ncbi:unnamed protein product [Macrosiphum euphorbiae]|uniref:Uncharacterized protein n=1 Tax=Macrosiphum euphorbiae TaxID=13131 RepID=A0AAV0X184_9HEMI|nr:unnamed protein product [Macrosiphum euphorbiae]